MFQIIQDGRSSLNHQDFRFAYAYLGKARLIPGCERSKEVVDFAADLARFLPRQYSRGCWLFQTIKSGDNLSGAFSTILTESPLILAQGENGDVQLIEAWTRRLLKGFGQYPQKSVLSYAISSDRHYAISGGDDKIVRLWDLDQGNCIRFFEGHTGSIYAIAFAPYDRWVLTNSKDNTFRLWDVASGHYYKFCKEHNAALVSEFTADGREIISAGSNVFNSQTLEVWDLENGQRLHTLGRINKFENIYSYCVSSDGEWFLVGGGKESPYAPGINTFTPVLCLYLYNLKTGKLVWAVEEYGCSWIDCLKLTPDNHFALSGSSHDPTARLWDLRTGKCVGRLEGHALGVTRVDFTKDAIYGITEDVEGTIRFWRIDWECEPKSLTDWDEAARIYLKKYLTWHTPFVNYQDPGRRGKPLWTDDDFKRLLTELQYRGYGWLRAEGIRRELEKMAYDWQEPPPFQ